MNDATVSLTGNLTSEPQHSETEDGVARTTFRFAHTPRRRDRAGSWVDGDTTFYSVTCWRSLAQNVAQSLHKGDPVVLTGTLRGRDWTNGERSGTSLEISALTVGHDLGRGVSLFRRVSRRVPEAAASGEPGSAAEGAVADDLAGVLDDEALLEPVAF